MNASHERRTEAELKAIPEPRLRPELKEELRRRLATEPVASGWRPTRFGTIAAAVLTVVAMVVLLIVQGQRDDGAGEGSGDGAATNPSGPRAATAGGGDESTTFRGDIARTGFFPGALSGGTDAGSLVFVGSTRGELHAVDAATGRVVWKTRLSGAIRGGATVAGGTVYIGSWDGTVHALDARTAKRKWAFKTGRMVFASPAVVDGVVYAVSHDTSTYALDVATGRARWKSRTGGSVSGANIASPAVSGGLVFTSAWASGLFALDSRTGAKVWRFDTREPVLSSPAVHDGVVYFGSDDGGLFALRTSTGERVWALQLERAGSNGPEMEPITISCAPAISDGRLFVGGYDRNLHAYDAKSGRPIWIHEVDDIITQSVAVHDGVIYAGSGALLALDAATGERLWELNTGHDTVTPPAIAHGVVYATTFSRAMPNPRHDVRDTPRPPRTAALIAVDAKTGKLRWRTELAGESLGAAVIASPRSKATKGRRRL